MLKSSILSDPSLYRELPKGVLLQEGKLTFPGITLCVQSTYCLMRRLRVERRDKEHENTKKDAHVYRKMRKYP